jgi:hypothetical protein
VQGCQGSCWASLWGTREIEEACWGKNLVGEAYWGSVVGGGWDVVTGLWEMRECGQGGRDGVTSLQGMRSQCWVCGGAAEVVGQDVEVGGWDEGQRHRQAKIVTRRRYRWNFIQGKGHGVFGLRGLGGMGTGLQVEV